MDVTVFSQHISFCSLSKRVRDLLCLLSLVSIPKYGKVGGGIFNFKCYYDFPQSHVFIMILDYYFIYLFKTGRFLCY